MKKPAQVVERFIQAINQHDVDEVLALSSSGHVLIDGGGASGKSEEKLRRAWTAYFEMFPDCKITIEQTVSNNDVVVLFGSAEGNHAPQRHLCSKNRWKIPATWLAVKRGNFVESWRVYADTAPVSEIMNKF